MKMRMSLLVTVVSVVLLTGCVANPDPRISASQSTSARSDLWQQAASAERFLAGVYRAADSMSLPGCGDWCAAATAMHQAHDTVLSQPDPWGGYNDSTVITLIDYGDEASLKQDLARAANEALAADQAGLAAATTGPETLLWASLVATANASVAFANDQTVAMPALQPGAVVPSQIDIGTSADADSAALSSANAVIYAATVGAAQATTSDGLKESLGAAIREAKADRDALDAQISALGVTPAPPALSYPLDAGVGSDDAVLASLAPYQTNLANAYVRLAGTMTGQDAVDTAMTANFTGATLTWWPGWG
ncbi:MAG: ferritin-like domain-containing protein [Propionibacteriaceae bacterium]|nr:ferritin-like domain-containing protein [Propionibacteriaceae bacterium]